MPLLRLALLCLITALLPLEGFARATNSSCATHRNTVTLTAVSAHEHDAHADHGAMALHDMARHDVDHAAPMSIADDNSSPPAHDDCHCSGDCAAHCSAASVTTSLAAPTQAASDEAPMALASRDPQPARRLALLRPPADAHV